MYECSRKFNNRIPLATTSISDFREFLVAKLAAEAVFRLYFICMRFTLFKVIDPPVVPKSNPINGSGRSELQILVDNVVRDLPSVSFG